jgi:hypothetical protein
MMEGRSVKRLYRAVLVLAALLMLGGRSFAAGPNAKIMDTAKPIVIDGDLSDFTGSPTFVLDQKSQVVSGKLLWKGAETSSAKVFITYDKTNLYIGANIMSLNPQFNTQRDAEIYNGDCLEIYFGTDNSNPDRASYSPTDYQIGLSPGKKGDKPQVFSFTDKGEIPGSKIATKAFLGGYTIEAQIPLAFLYKINVAPGKNIGFDLALDDTGAGGSTRAIQLTWSESDKSWQTPAVWGSLTFGGSTVFNNTAPKMNATSIENKEMNVEAGKTKASTKGVLLWGFNGGSVGGFEGKVSSDSKITSEGNGSLAIDVEGSVGWNQSLAVSAEIPTPEKWENFKALSFDLYMPPGSMSKVSFGEIYVVTQSPSANWNQAIKVKIQEGWNFIYADVDPTMFKGGVTKFYLVFNTGGPLTGTAYLDNIRGVERGANGKLNGKVTDINGAPIADALVAIAKKSYPTDANGSFSAEMGADDYKVEVLKDGYEIAKDMVTVETGKDNVWSIKLTPMKITSSPAVVTANFSQKLRTINMHYMIGENLAAWHKPAWLKGAALQRSRGVFDFIRVPGGAYANIWRWKQGDVLRKDGKTVDWAPEVKWDDMVTFIKALGPNSEALMTLNMATGTVQDALDWIADAKAKGIKVKYVELGNEPDYEAELMYNGQTNYWTVIDNYCQHYLEFAKAIRAKYPDLKIMGPTTAQLGNRERKEGAPWLAPVTALWWDEELLKRCGPYVDVVSLHTYPYWSNDSEYNLMLKTNAVSEYLPKLKKIIAQYCPGRHIEIGITEWNSGDENAMTAKLANGIFTADFMGQMLVSGVDFSNNWDLFTQKPGLGGGHGVFDPDDAVRPFSERAHYWALYMFRKYFGDTLFAASTNQELLTTYSSTQGTTKYIMVVNRSRDTKYPSKVDFGAGNYNLELYTFGPKQYQWAENLYRAVLNSGPVYQKAGKPVSGSFVYTFQPYTITAIKLTPADAVPAAAAPPAAAK